MIAGFAFAQSFASGLFVTSSNPQEQPESLENSPEESLENSPEESLENSPEREQSSRKGFLSSTYEELKLVVWPTRQQLFSESIAVILMVTMSAAAIAAVSRFYGWGASQIFR